MILRLKNELQEILLLLVIVILSQTFLLQVWFAWGFTTFFVSIIVTLYSFGQFPNLVKNLYVQVIYNVLSIYYCLYFQYLIYTWAFLSIGDSGILIQSLNPYCLIGSVNCGDESTATTSATTVSGSIVQSLTIASLPLTFYGLVTCIREVKPFVLSLYSKPNIFTVYAHLSPHVGNIFLSGVVVVGGAAGIFISSQDGFLNLTTDISNQNRLLDSSWEAVHLYYDTSTNMVHCTKGNLILKYDPLTDSLGYTGPLLDPLDQDYIAQLCKSYHNHYYDTAILTREGDVVPQRFRSSCE